MSTIDSLPSEINLDFCLMCVATFSAFGPYPHGRTTPVYRCAGLDPRDTPLAFARLVDDYDPFAWQDCKPIARALAEIRMEEGFARDAALYMPGADHAPRHWTPTRRA